MEYMDCINFYTVTGYFILRSATKGFFRRNAILMLVDKYLTFVSFILILQVIGKIICSIFGSH